MKCDPSQKYNVIVVLHIETEDKLNLLSALYVCTIGRYHLVPYLLLLLHISSVSVSTISIRRRRLLGQHYPDIYLYTPAYEFLLSFFAKMV